jgi:hypothetical protein
LATQSADFTNAQMLAGCDFQDMNEVLELVAWPHGQLTILDLRFIK